MQNCLLAETVGSHSFYGGMLMNYSNPAHRFELDKVSIHHNAFVRIEGRLPEVSRESRAAANSAMDLEISSNLYWGPDFFIAVGHGTGVVTDGNGGHGTARRGKRRRTTPAESRQGQPGHGRRRCRRGRNRRFACPRPGRIRLCDAQ